MPITVRQLEAAILARFPQDIAWVRFRRIPVTLWGVLQTFPNLKIILYDNSRLITYGGDHFTVDPVIERFIHRLAPSMDVQFATVSLVAQFEHHRRDLWPHWREGKVPDAAIPYVPLSSLTDSATEKRKDSNMQSPTVKLCTVLAFLKATDEALEGVAKRAWGIIGPRPNKVDRDRHECGWSTVVRILEMANEAAKLRGHLYWTPEEAVEPSRPQYRPELGVQGGVQSVRWLSGTDTDDSEVLLTSKGELVIFSRPASGGLRINDPAHPRVIAALNFDPGFTKAATAADEAPKK